MILRQTFKNHFLAFEFNLSLALILLMAIWYFNWDPDAWLILGIGYTVVTLPSIFLHIIYYIKNRGEEIDLAPNKIIVKKNGNERIYTDEDIAEIFIYKSANMDNGIPMMGLEYYYFARIITKQGEQIIITCLMSRKIDKLLKEYIKVPFWRRHNMFAISSTKYG